MTAKTYKKWALFQFPDRTWRVLVSHTPAKDDAPAVFEWVNYDTFKECPKTNAVPQKARFVDTEPEWEAKWNEFKAQQAKEADVKKVKYELHLAQCMLQCSEAEAAIKQADAERARKKVQRVQEELDTLLKS